MQGQEGANIVNLSDTEDENAALENSAGGPIKIERRDSLIINNDCRRIMRNLCSRGAASMGKFREAAGAITQPSFLSPEDRVLFFKTKMFYLLQERQNLMEESAEVGQDDGKKGIQKFADAYPPNQSPFSDSFTIVESGRPSVKLRRSRGNSELQLTTPVGARPSSWITTNKERMKTNVYVQKAGLAKFLDNLRKGDQSVLHKLDEKILKTIEGAGYAVLINGKDIKKADILLKVFPDFNQLMTAGRDEESQLNNLVSHVRIRLKAFDKLQSFYENPSHEDHMAQVFAITNHDRAEIRPEIAAIGNKRMYEIDEKKIQKLFAIFKDDYGSAKTTLIADGTQPVVLNRKKQDRLKKYVDDCADFKGNMLVPYVRETNFFFLTFPWHKNDSILKRGDSGESVTMSYD